MENNTDRSEAAEYVQAEIHAAALWEVPLAEMRREGVEAGKTYSVEWFENRLAAKQDTPEYGIAVSRIRRALEHDGLYLTARGQVGSGFILLPPAANDALMRAYEHGGTDMFQRAVILGSNTDLTKLTNGERRRHEATLARIAQKAALVNRRLPRGVESGDHTAVDG